VKIFVKKLLQAAKYEAALLHGVALGVVSVATVLALPVRIPAYPSDGIFIAVPTDGVAFE
jgi:hypothetical protein